MGLQVSLERVCDEKKKTLPVSQVETVQTGDGPIDHLGRARAPLSCENNIARELTEGPSFSKKPKLENPTKKENQLGGATRRHQEVGTEQGIPSTKCVPWVVVQKILNLMDLRTVLLARRVCKNWLETIHNSKQEFKGIVRLPRASSTNRVQDFISFIQNRSPTLPHPFGPIHADLYSPIDGNGDLTVLHQTLLRQISALPNPLTITGLSLEGVGWCLSIPVIMGLSSTLEFIKLVVLNCETGYKPTIISKQFPKLRHLVVDASIEENSDLNVNENEFAQILSKIVGTGCCLETFESWSEYAESSVPICSDLLISINLANVKKLSILRYAVTPEASDRFLRVKFRQLETLRADIQVLAPGLGVPRRKELIETAAQVSLTLQKLDLSTADSRELLLAPNPDFPGCPNLKVLHMGLYPGWDAFVTRCFPFLNDFTAHIKDVSDDEVGRIFVNMFPFLGVKTFRLMDCVHNPDQFGPLEIFRIFQKVERLNIHSSFLIEYCRLKLDGDQTFTDLLNDVVHLELQGTSQLPHGPNGAAYVWLSALKSIQRIRLIQSNRDIICIASQDLPRLKTIEFPWGDCCDIKGLEMLAQRVEMLLVTNCCSIPRIASGVLRSKESLEYLFESAPNVRCGCKDRDKGDF